MSNVNENAKFINFKDTEAHTVFYKFIDDLKSASFPDRRVNKWDIEHVRMPFSSLSFHPVITNGKKSLIPRWQLIEKNLKRLITNVYEMKEIIMSYNTKFESQWDFEVLYQLFEDELDVAYKTEFFSKIYPEVTRLALNLPNLITKPIPLLKVCKPHSISLSQTQISSLLANAFLCTFPRRNKVDNDSEYSHFPSINFSSLFNNNKSRSRYASNKSKTEKLKCILHYFKRVTEKPPEGIVTFTRRVLPEPGHIGSIDWQTSECQFKNIVLQVDSTGSIFSSASDSIKVDFANKYVGGGVLGHGSVQEEIVFSTQPELIVARLFTERLGDRETLLVQGSELFCLHSGYGRSFEFRGDFTADSSPGWHRDQFGRWRNTITMLDALSFNGEDKTKDQFERDCIIRELNKAYCGFGNLPIVPGANEEPLPNTISTGNWGCGAFGGDVYLKFLIQLIACTQLGKHITYYTFNNSELADDIYQMFQYLHNTGYTIGFLWQKLLDFRKQPRLHEKLLFEYIKHQ